MIPKLTDDAVSRLPLGSGRAELLEEIMTTVAPDRQNAEPTRLAHPRRTRWLARSPRPRWLPAWPAGRCGGSSTVRTRTAPARWPPRSACRRARPSCWTRRAGEVDSLDGDGIRFRNGDAELEITSYDAKQYDSYVTDRKHIVDPPAPGEPIEVLGRPAQMWAYSAYDHTAIREVQDGHWMEFRAAGLDRAAYLALLGQLRLTSDAEFNASLPEDYVAEGERAEAAEQLLGEIRGVSGAGYPRGETPSFAEGDAKDYYQFGAEVAGSYACAWLEQFENAKTHDQAGLASEAARVLGTSREWPILKKMNADGGYSEVVWQLADEAVAGKVPDWYREGLGCS